MYLKLLSSCANSELTTLCHPKWSFQYGLFTINMFPQLRGDLNAEFSISSIWVHGTDCSSIGIGKIVEIPPVRNIQLILKVHAELQKSTSEVVQDFYTEFHSACSTKYFVVFLREWKGKGAVKLRLQKPELKHRLLQKWSVIKKTQAAIILSNLNEKCSVLFTSQSNIYAYWKIN